MNDPQFDRNPSYLGGGIYYFSVGNIIGIQQVSIVDIGVCSITFSFHKWEAKPIHLVLCVSFAKLILDSSGFPG